MIVLLQYDLDKEIVENIKQSDLQGDDLMDLINETALYQDKRHGVWHFPDSAVERLNVLLKDLLDTTTKEN